MARFSDTLVNQNQIPVAGALVYVSSSTTGVPASLTDDEGNPLLQPIFSGSDGSYYFNVADGLYDLIIRFGGREIARRYSEIIGSVAILPAGSVANFLGTSTTVAPSQAAVTAGLAPFQPLTPIAAQVLVGKIDGSDNGSILRALSLLGPVIVPPGNYTISTNIALPSMVSFQPGARLNIATGVTVTFAGGVEAGDYQIFNLFGTGAVAGLAASRLAWFMADLLNSPSQTIADPFVQAAYTATRGPVDWPRGDWFSDGRGIVVSKGQASRGFGRAQSRMLFTTATANGLLHTSTEKPSVIGIGFDMASSNTIATSGMMLSFDANAGNHTVDDVYANAGFNGYYAGNGCNTGKISNSDFNNMMNTATWKDGGVNIIFDTLSCSAFSDWFDLSSTTGFLAGESITWSGGSGSYGYTTSSTRAKCVINDVSPTVGTTITGSTSGATATLTALHVGHQQGGNRRTGNCAGYGEVNCSWAGGALACASDAITNAHGSRPEYGKTVACFFDHSDGGCQDITLVGAQYIGCWFSARHYIGWYGDKVQYLNLADCHFDANWLDGWTTTANAHDVTVSGGYAAGNNRSNTARAGGLIFGTRIAVLGQRSGGGTTSSSFDGTQANPYKVDASASVIVINSCLISYGNMTNTISGTSSGTNF